jgi:holo-ACP synthase/triphosphoribosyl-dephospho-CoA synthase
MTTGIGEDFNRPGASHGETLHKSSGIWGVRGEARAGFPQVREHSLPVLRDKLAAGFSVNDAGIAALLHLLAHTEDTNIVYRAGAGTLNRIQKDAAAFLEKRPSLEAMKTYARELDGKFAGENISPGGSADLLALTFFLDQLTAV